MNHPSSKKGDGDRVKNTFSSRHPMLSWALLATFMTIILSSIFSFLSETVLVGANIIISIIIAMVFILLNVVTDTLGVSVTACDKVPFVSMASKKVKGAKEALILIDNADKISNICSDIIGDICGIMSGTVGANMVVEIIKINEASMESILVSVLISTAISGITVFFKAVGKYLATRYYRQIVLFSSNVLRPFLKTKKGKKKKTSNKNKI